MLLQKTLLNIEGLGRDLDPDLDLWTTAKPYLERWMSEQVGWRGLWRHIRDEAPQWSALLPQLPRLLHRALSDRSSLNLQAAVMALVLSQQRHNRLLAWVLAVLLFILILAIARWFA